jgi:N-acetylmuramoyl-L-alanine amidase
MKRILAFLLVIIFLAACVHNKYASTNKTYKKQVKNYAKLLQEYPVKDSGGLQYADNWVGTTNFSMRRPNFVLYIILHKIPAIQH